MATGKTKSKKLRLPSMHAIRKRIYQSLPRSKAQQRDVLLIFGCQRSGTSMFAEAFRYDMDSDVFGERGLSDGDDIRLPVLDIVGQRLDNSPAALRVAKPLVESQRAAEILDFFQQARAVWMFRNYTDVALSAAKRFSGEAPFRNLRPIVDAGLEPDFAAEHVTSETRQLVERLFSADMHPDAAQALYWYVRNIRYFEQQLNRHPRVLLCSYETFLEQPGASMKKVYEFLGRKFPGTQIVSHIAAPVRKQAPAKLALPPELQSLCDDLLDRLQQQAAEQRR